MRTFQCWRLTRAHHPVNINQCVFAAVIAICCQRIAQMRAKINIVDEQNVQLLDPGFGKFGERLFGKLVTSLGKNLACRHIHNIVSNKASQQIIVGHEN